MTVKVRYGDRTTITRSHTVGAPLDSPRALGAVAGALLDAVDVSPGIRLLGVSVSGLLDTDTTARQLSFDDGDEAAPAASGPVDEAASGRAGVAAGTPGPPGAAHGAAGAGVAGTGVAGQGARHLAWHEVEAAVSAIRARYGNASVGPATLVGRDGLAVKERGDTQWGPSTPPEPTGDDR